MNYITSFISQFMFISTLIAVSYFGDPYLRGPFTNVQIKAIILAAFIMVLMFSLMNRLNKRCRPIRFVNKIFITLAAIMAASLLIGLLTREVIF
ncbi:hypothetical protein MOE47_01315 [Bacillus atrophaeus]|uniref:hypothetical protein n=2 Tax=Bacillus atrophaeus TaxID=1452 RepID=UPI00227E04F5|nr:hypothetical protein [Bacillus atrophaeus]MCY8913948.1 hypothetical protein [Bacillus atrophaeus]MCY9113093.1 hypothetical protein [Bacillus atrophaeus]MEC0925325.1 hypothetical protein [Bacillus atrophaeus]